MTPNASPCYGWPQVTEDDFDFLPNDKTVEMLESSKSKGIIGTVDEASKVPANLKGDGKGERALLTKLKNNLAAPKKWTIKGVEVHHPR